MITVINQQSNHSLEKGTQVVVVDGGYGCLMANGAKGTVVLPDEVDHTSTWPLYAGASHNIASLFILSDININNANVKITFGLGIGCIVKILKP